MVEDGKKLLNKLPGDHQKDNGNPAENNVDLERLAEKIVEKLLRELYIEKERLGRS